MKTIIESIQDELNAVAYVALQIIHFQSGESKLWIKYIMYKSAESSNTSCNCNRIIAHLSEQVETMERRDETTKGQTTCRKIGGGGGGTPRKIG